jgi:hypothetical protein
MGELEQADMERDPRFPSGPWTGFFLQYWLPGRHRTDLTITWREGRILGSGYDRVGTYNIDGTYDLATGRSEWIKKYHRKHSVAYRGVNDGHGIWGVWEIRQLAGLYVDRGGFHIWPRGTDVSAESAETERAVLEVMRREFGSPMSRLVPRLLLGGTLAAAAYLLWRNGGF